MPANTVLYTTVDGKKYSFKGSMGLAPEWLNKGMDTKKQKWVSACMLARTNYVGKHLQISMRATPPIVKTLESSPEEQKEFSIYEGSFFGNLFIDKPVAYTCVGDYDKVSDDPILKLRLCTKPSGKKSPTNEATSMCDFIITGKCDDPKSQIVNGEKYAEVVKVYLKPGLGSYCGDHCPE